MSERIFSWVGCSIQRGDNRVKTFITCYSACRRRGGVLKCPRFCFFLFFSVESIDIYLSDCLLGVKMRGHKISEI